jgi:hypothetical protein
MAAAYTVDPGLTGMRDAGRRLPALLLALAAVGAGAASAEAGSGGAVGPGGGGDDGGGGDGGCVNLQFGERNLSRGDCGKDVKTLNWILRAEAFAVPLDEDFAGPTDDSVRAFERDAGQPVNGVVESTTREALIDGLRRDRASWYGPGFWGNRTACGQTLTRRTVGVAHRRLPCGTKVVLGYKGRWVRTRVIDRGPFAKRSYTRDWDLTKRAAKRIGLIAAGTDWIRAGVIR